MTKGKIWFALGVLFAINMLNFYDRLIIGAVGESIAVDWKLSDSQLGYLGTAFILLYAAVGVPLGRLSDRVNRSRILTIGVTVWSILTALSGMAQNFWPDGRPAADRRRRRSHLRAGLQLADRRSVSGLDPRRAMSIFMLGLPLGNAGALLISGIVTKQYGWQSAFFVALIPGLLCASAPT